MELQEQPNSKVEIKEKEVEKLTEKLEVKVEKQEVKVEKESEKPKTQKKKPIKLLSNVIFTKSKRKRSVARASAVPGTGVIRINSKLIDTITPPELRAAMLKSIYLSDVTKDIAKNLNIKVNVYGGGVSSQAQAIAGAIARIIVEKGGEPVKEMLIDYDRRLIIDDSRRVEPKKFLGPKARARFQTSYR